MNDDKAMNDTTPDPGYDAYPLLPLKNVVIFPHTIVTLMVGRPRSLRALEHALAANKRLVVMTQRNTSSEEPIPDDLYEVGSLIEITSYQRQSDGNYQVIVEGLRRVRAVRFMATDWLYDVEIAAMVEQSSEGATSDALMRHVLGLFTEFGRLNQRVPADVLDSARHITDAGQLADVVAAHVVSDAAQRQQLLAQTDQTVRLERVGVVIAGELDVLQIDERIRAKVRSQIDKNQREFYLREQLKAIHDELSGEGGNEIAELRQKVVERKLPEEVNARLLKELSRLERMTAAAPEASVARTYIDWLLSLPWTEQTEDCDDIRIAEEALDADHYGLERIKERIIEFLAVRQLVTRGGGHKTMAQVLCFAGPPGVGKTSLGQSIARAMNRKFVRISLGGVHDEAEIRGHRRTYVGAMPGRIIQGIKQGGSRNPVVLLDEIDKLTSDQRGDPTAALLEVLDPAQNDSFVDHYIDLPFDLSQTLFITTANYIGNIPRPLRDRMEMIELSGYTEDEKVQIARRYLITRELEGHGLARGYIEIPDKVYRAIIREYTREAGVRDLERKLAAICRKAARQLVGGRSTRVRITPNNLESYLGPARYNADSSLSKLNQVGVVTGLAWTEVGGEVLPVEVATMPGRGNLTITGRLGDVMQESARAALSYARSRATQLHIDPDFQATTDLHIHLPEGAIPKDGPSAGITMATALISALTQQPVRADTAMTGEITLRGRVLAIGGLKEKVLAAHRNGIKRIIAPRENQRDLIDIPARVRQELEFLWVENMDEVVAAALERPLAIAADEQIVSDNLPPADNEAAPQDEVVLQAEPAPRIEVIEAPPSLPEQPAV